MNRHGGAAVGAARTNTSTDQPYLDRAYKLQDHARAELAKLPVPLRALTPAIAPYYVTLAPPLRQLAAEVDRPI